MDHLTSPPDVAATFCATLVDEWVRAGVSRAFVAPGSRSTPMALALVADARVAVSVHHDERSASFAALGSGLATGEPAVVLTTSGTAAVECHAAVVEADLSGVPLIVVTADRPAELHGVGAAQTVDQTQLFGGSVRAFFDHGVPSAVTASAWRSLAAHCVIEARDRRPGPVQLNIGFREPLVGSVQQLPAGRFNGDPWHCYATDPSLLVDRLSGRRGVIVAGGGVVDPAAVRELADALGWPVLADPRSGCRVIARSTIAHADALLRVDAFASAHQPEVVLRVGELWASKVVNAWLDRAPEYLVLVARGRDLSDPSRIASVFVVCDERAVVDAVGGLVSPAPPDWLISWSGAERLARTAIDAWLNEASELTEPHVARSVMAAAPSGSAVVAASSMPVRDLEWYAPARTDVSVYSNRGANGIDGVVSTALGVALTGRSTIALVGDVAFLHDSSALVALAARHVPLTLVVVDNDGGGIFSFLAQHDVLEPHTFEQLFGTPHGADIAALASAHKIPVEEPRTIDELEALLRAPAGAPRLVVVRTDRERNVEVHRVLHARVAQALSAEGR